MTGNREREAGAPAPAGGASDPAAVGMDDGPDDGQPQAAAATVTGAGVVTADEGLEDMGRDVIGNSRPVVLDAECESSPSHLASTHSAPGFA